MAGVTFAVEGDGVGFATESYAASALYTTLASLSGALWRIRQANELPERPGLARNGHANSVAQCPLSAGYCCKAFLHHRLQILWAVRSTIK
jgi:hypothetical protein